MPTSDHMGKSSGDAQVPASWPPEVSTVFSQIEEGVVMVNRQLAITYLNARAARMLGTQDRSLLGKNILEARRNLTLRDALARALEEAAPVEVETLLRETNVLVRIRAMALPADGARAPGAVALFSDITKVRRLESLRRDFAANVSHELKTPITSIAGFVETLLDGALQDPGEATRYLKIVEKQTARLQQIIEDLLMLARIEQQVEGPAIERQPTSIHSLLQAIMENYGGRAGARAIQVRIECEPSLAWPVNEALLEHAVANLLDNAIKYSAPGGQIILYGLLNDSQLAIRVVDQGCGIGPEHYERIFERFYCVDKARSRELGGTGLGLAIVKHIAQAHGGRITVESQLGQGSTFTLLLPSG